MPKRKWLPRLSIHVPEDLYFALQKGIPWGVKNPLFVVLAWEVLRLTKENGFDWIVRLIDGSAHIEVVDNVHKKA